MVLHVYEVERRFLRACQTIRALPDREQRFILSGQVGQAMWRNVVDEFTAYGYTEEVLPKFRPTPADVSDCLNALSWANGMDKKDFRYLWWRSFDVSFSVIAARIGRSDETARRRYRDAVTYLWAEANRQASAA